MYVEISERSSPAAPGVSAAAAAVPFRPEGFLSRDACCYILLLLYKISTCGTPDVRSPVRMYSTTVLTICKICAYVIWRVLRR